MKLTRRFLALLLALSMSLSMVTPAFASETPDEIEEPAEVVEEVIDVVDVDADADVEEEAEEPAPVVEEEDVPVVEEEAEEPAPVVEEEAEEPAPVVEEEDVPVVEEEAEEPAPVVEDEDVPVVEEEAEEPAPVVEEEDVLVVEEEAEEPAPVVEEEIAEEEAAGEEAPEGTETNPIQLEQSSWTSDGAAYTMTVTVPAGSTVWYAISNGFGMHLWIDDVDQGVMTGDTTTAHTFFITNEGEAEAEYVLKIAYPVGSSENPAVIDELPYTGYTVLDAGDKDGYNYTYTATAAGYLAFAFTYVSEGVTADISVSNGRSWEQKTLAADAENGLVMIEVVEGDVLSIVVATVPGDDWTYPAAELGWTASFYTAEALPGTSAEVAINISALLVWNENHTSGSATVTVPAGATRYFAVDRVDGMLLTGAAKEAIELTCSTMNPAVFSITNEDAEKAATYNLSIDYPVGSQQNPELIWDPTSFTAKLEAGDSDGYYFTFYNRATTGTLVLTPSAAEGIEFDMNVTNTTTGVTYWLVDSTDGTVSVDILPGDSLVIQVAALSDTEGKWYPAAEISVNGYIEYPVGSSNNPEAIWDPASAVANVPEGSDQGYYLNFYNRGVTGALKLAPTCVEDTGFNVILTNMTTNDMAWLSDSTDGTVSIAMAPGDMIGIQIAIDPDPNWNYPAATVSLNGEILYAEGTRENPEAVALGDTSIELAAGTEGYNYSWTATGTGYMTFKMITKDGWSYTISNVTAGTYGDFTTSDDGSAIASLYVHEGEEIQIAVNTYDPENPYSAPAGTIKFNLSLNAATKEVVSGKKLTLTFMNNGKKVSGSKVNWTVVDAYVYNPYGEPVHFDDTTAYATLKNGTLTTKKCGDQIHMVINATLKADPSVTTTYYVDILPAPTKLAIWTEEAPVWNNSLAWILNYQESEMKLNAFSFPINANQNVKWTSSNKKVITIDEDGTMHATGKAGKATITATAVDGSKKKASVVVEVMRYAEYLEIYRKDGKPLDKIEMRWHYEWDAEKQEDVKVVDEYVEGAIVDAGKSISLGAKVDPNASNKKVYWYCWSECAKVSSSGKVTISKDAPDGTKVWVYAESWGYSDEFVIEVNNNKVTVDFYYDNVDEDFFNGETVWMSGPNSVTFNTTGMKAGEQPTLCLRGVEIDSNGDWVRDVQKYKLSNSKVLDMNIVRYWNEWNEDIQDVIKHYDIPEDFPEEAIQYEVQLTPKLGVTGTTKVTATSADGKAKNVYTIIVSNYATSIELTTKDGKKLEQEIYDYMTGESTYIDGNVIHAVPGQTITLKANINGKEKIYWGANEYNWNPHNGEFVGSDSIKVSNGKLTIPKDIVEETEIWVWASVYNMEAATRIVVTPKASNVHVRAQFSAWEPMKYVSNTTKAWDITADRDWDGQADTTMELSALVYPFSASQNVKWTVSNNKVATVVENKDGTATLKFTGKTGKLTVTATTEDGSKVKSSFTLNVVKSVKSLELKSDLTVNAGKKLAVNKALTINPSDATNKKVTWSMQMLDENGALVDVPKTIATLSTSGSLTTKKAAAGVTIFVTATANDGFGATVTQPVVVK